MTPPADRTCLILRHAVALGRHSWETDDAERPLSPRGERQAEEIAKRTASFEVARVVSSPAVRCVSTVTPLALAIDLAVETVDYLAEGSDGAEALFLVIQATLGLDGEATLVVCTHGDVLSGMLGALGRSGALEGAPPSVQKAGAVSLRLDQGVVAGVEIIGPPR